MGIGLGFNFSRVEYDIQNEKVKVDGKPLGNAWRFWKFELRVPAAPSRNSEGEEEDLYVGMLACFSGDENLPLPVDEGEVKFEDGYVRELNPAWLKRWDAKTLLERAVKELGDTGDNAT